MDFILQQGAKLVNSVKRPDRIGVSYGQGVSLQVYDRLDFVQGKQHEVNTMKNQGTLWLLVIIGALAIAVDISREASLIRRLLRS